MAVEAVVSAVIHRLTNLLTEEFKTFGKVRDEVEKVLSELRRMRSVLNNAEDEERSKQELQLLGKVYRLGDAVESLALAEKKGFLKKRRLIKSEMKIISEEITKPEDEIPSLAMALHKNSNSMCEHAQPWQYSEAYYATNKEKTIFKKDVEKLLEQLTSNSKPLQIISVFGEVGIGKTDHVKKVYKKLKTDKKFQCSALVVMDAKWSVRNLMKVILGQVTGSKVKEKLKEEVLRGRLHGFLKDRTYLIVIIDIESHDLLDKLRGALPDAYKGSRVVITTSNREAASFADESNHYHFKPLNLEDSLKVFINKAWGRRGSPFSTANMEDLKNKIAESCGGVVLRIELLAGLLSIRGEIYEEWSKVYEQSDFVTKSPSFDIFDFCYNDVPVHLKPCLLYLTLFGKGVEIPVRRLLRLWLAEGFVKPSSGIAREDVVEGYLEELVKRNLVEITKRRSDESPKKCRIVEDLHDIFLPRALRMGLFYLQHKLNEHSSATSEYPFKSPRVVEYTNIEDYSTSEAFNQNLQSYISVNGRKKDMPAKEVEGFLKKIIGVRGFGLLKVLDLEGVYRPRLPENLGNLFHLRYIGLRWTSLDTLPSSLGSLLYLETLDIKHTHITTLPSSILNMKHLHHLCLNGARLDISTQSIKHRGPSHLQTLWGLFVDEEIARKFGLTLRRMTNLRKLDITSQSSSTTTRGIILYSSPYEEISLLSSLQSLRLRSKDKTGCPAELIIEPLQRLENLSKLYLLGQLIKPLSWYQFPPGLKNLTLSVSKLGEDPMPTLSRLPNLIVLRLLASSFVGEQMHCPKYGFPSLRVLKLWKLEELKTLTADDGTMQKLHTMEIRCCVNLNRLPSTLLQIQSFDKLILTNMPEAFVSSIRKEKMKHTKVEVQILDF